MKIYVGVTDRDWYDHLRSRHGIDEVNFWQPGGSNRFGAISPGDLFLFKLKYPMNAIAGGGTFVSFDRFPAWLAWDAFEQKNGASSYEDFRRLLNQHRDPEISVAGIEQIGCIILGDPFFLPQEKWIPAPRDWAPNIVQGKTYDSTYGEGAILFEQVMATRTLAVFGDSLPVTTIPGPMFGETGPGRRRLGQGSFRLMVLDAYDRKCAVSGEKALPVLESAHIRPVAMGGHHRIDNGLLLRSDIHTLFDRGYLTITPEGQFKASRRLKSDYNNGEPYYALESRLVTLPQTASARPSAEFLEWHNAKVFFG